jgi:hypothetical protein
MHCTKLEVRIDQPFFKLQSEQSYGFGEMVDKYGCWVELCSGMSLLCCQSIPIRGFSFVLPQNHNYTRDSKLLANFTSAAR